MYDVPYRSPQVFSATQLLTDTGTALGDHPCIEVILQNLAANSVVTLVGHAAGTTPFELKAAGETIRFRVANSNLIFVKNKSTTATQYVNYIVLK